MLVNHTTDWQEVKGLERFSRVIIVPWEIPIGRERFVEVRFLERLHELNPSIEDYFLVQESIDPCVDQRFCFLCILRKKRY